MTGFDYTRARATAEKLIARFGQSGSIRRFTNSGTSYDPTVTNTDYACTLVDLDYDDSQVDGTLIKTTDRMVYLSTAGLSIRPEIADKVIIGGVEHSIMNVMPLSPGGATVMFQLQARR